MCIRDRVQEAHATQQSQWASALERLQTEHKREVDDLIFPFTEQERTTAMGVARQLREQGRRVEIILDHPKLKRAMADADRIGAQRIWMLGPDELERGSARVRDLQTGEERDEPLPE